MCVQYINQMFLLKLFHKFVLLGTPLLTYNPFTGIFNAPFHVEPYSTYLNFKLTSDQVLDIASYISEYTNDLKLVPVKILKNDKPDFFLSVNIYNVTSSLFMNWEKPVTRCEINTYVRDSTGKIGTLILDYCSNALSIDPVNMFKMTSYTSFVKLASKDPGLKCRVQSNKMDLDCDIGIGIGDHEIPISDELCRHTDNIYYKNGIYDKLYYDSSLIHATVLRPVIRNISFRYRNMLLGCKQLHSKFYFKNKLNFLCSIWHNV
jgi:hypothetical protein